LDGSEPANEVEAMLLIQMATTHALTMKLARRLASVDTIQQTDSASVTLARLQRTFTTQVETLANLRRGGRQKMTVEHVHVHSGGQAIVGNVNTGGGGEQIGNERQPHAAIDARTLALGAGPNGNYRHGRRTAEAIAERRELMAFIREARRFATQAMD
jgi:hypothetical protein